MIEDGRPIRETVTLHPETVEKGERVAEEVARAKRKPRSPKSPVKKTKVHPLVWKQARKLAGPHKKIVVESETSVLVVNS